MKELTNRQFEILLFISDSIDENSFPPTLREIGANFDITSKGVMDHVNAIIEKGYLKKNANVSRTITLTESGKEIIKEHKKGRTK